MLILSCTPTAAFLKLKQYPWLKQMGGKTDAKGHQREWGGRGAKESSEVYVALWVSIGEDVREKINQH